MAETTPATPVSITRLILVPSLITLGVTILRLVGELNNWSPVLFNRAPGGAGALVGISWLPLFFGPYFAVKLAKAGAGPVTAGKPVGFAVLGLVGFFVGSYLGFAPSLSFPGREVAGYGLMAAAAALQLAAWPAFGKTLLAYAYAARIPVAIVALLAILGNWGTHYDALPREYHGSMSVLPRYLETALLPQMIFWVTYTVIVGALLGIIVALVTRRGRSPRELIT